MLTLGLVCAKISAGAGYAILLRRRLGRFWRLVEAGGGCSAPSQPPPTSTTSRPSPTSFSQATSAAPARTSPQTAPPPSTMPARATAAGDGACRAPGDARGDRATGGEIGRAHV